MARPQEEYYRSKYPPLRGHSDIELLRNVLCLYHDIEKQTHRTPYIRTSKHSYFKGQKVFINLLLPHMRQKNPRERARRLRYFQAALDLLRHTSFYPTIKENPKKQGEQLLRFYGEVRDGRKFCVQVRRNTRGNYFLISIFPTK